MSEIGQNVGSIFFSNPVANALRNGIFTIAGRAVKQIEMITQAAPFVFLFSVFKKKRGVAVEIAFQDVHVILSGELVLTQDNLHTLKTAHAFQILSRARRPIYLWQRLKAKARELAFIHAGNEFVADVGPAANQLRNSENRRQFFCIRSQDVMIYIHEPAA